MKKTKQMEKHLNSLWESGNKVRGFVMGGMACGLMIITECSR